VTQWIRFEKNGRIGFGTLEDGAIAVHVGDIFAGAKPYRIDHKFAELDATLGEELLRPTHIYVPEALEILERVKGVKALINITSDGLLNLVRVEAQVGFEIDRLIEPQPIFQLIQQHANVDDGEMFEVFNIFNKKNFRTIDTNMNSTTFGAVTAIEPPRIVQLGAKFMF